MALETLSSNELLNFIIYDTISATPFSCNDSSETTTTTTTTTTNTTTTTTPCSSSFFLLENQNHHPPPPPPPPPNPFSHQEFSAMEIMSSNSNFTATTAKMSMAAQAYCAAQEISEKNSNSNNQNLGVQGGKKKRRRRPRVCKNKEEAENQRMTHIAVERNRRKQMNEHLAVLRSLMPESYVQRGDQASIVGGAIEFVKELEHLLQSLEAQKFLLTQKQPQEEEEEDEEGLEDNNGNFANNNIKILAAASTPFSQFFSYPQYTCSQIPNKYTSKSRAAIADIEVTLIETHANLRILSQKRLSQLSKMVACFQTLHLSILHLNITTLDPLVLYSISVKVEEGCRLNSADEIAGAVHQMLRIIEEEANNSIC